METILLFDKYNINYNIATILTKQNANKPGILELYNFISKLKNIKYWDLRTAFPSLYSDIAFEDFMINSNEADEIYKYVEILNLEKKISLNFDKIDSKKYRVSNKGSRFFNGSKCSALATHMFILPDGKVTICEQLYWNENFIIGNILTQSIEEIWNSPRSLELAFPNQQKLRDKIVCKSCEIFDDCTNEYHNKCWVDTMKAYGKNNWDYADPRCVKAPKLKYKMY